jgi:uncharacterized protein YehS (DUF1456 family)
MRNNDILRRLRYALAETDARMVAIFALKGQELSTEQVCAFMGKEDEEGVVYCPDEMLAHFLDGLILDRRGPPKSVRSAPAGALTNNVILKKLRIALTLHEDAMLSILAAGGQPLSKGELTALFRKPDHKHFRACGDQVLRKFLKGLTLKLRPSS